MGNPAVVFTTYSINSSTSWATTNVSGHAANSTSSPFVELKSDLVPQAAKFSNGDYSVADFDTIRTITTENTSQFTQMGICMELMKTLFIAQGEH